MPPETTVVLQIEENTMAVDSQMLSHMDARLIADRDRHSTNATSLEKLLELQYAASIDFRAANAARIVMEAGSGRTRAETNNPENTAAPQRTS